MTINSEFNSGSIYFMKERLFKLCGDLSCVKTSNKFERWGYISMNIHIIDSFMNVVILTFPSAIFVESF